MPDTSTEAEIKAILLQRQRLPDLPPDWKPTWRFVADEREIVVRRHLVGFLDLPNRPALGVTFGLIHDRNFAYDGLCFTEFGGGGVAMVPFALLDGTLWVLTTLQFRFLIGHVVDGFPRGYKPPGVSAEEHAKTEAMEEFGRSIFGSKHKPFRLNGEVTYSASHILDTRPLPDEPNPGGNQFAIQHDRKCFESGRGYQTLPRPVLKSNIFSPEDKLEALSQGRVLRWWEAAECSEGVIHTGVLRLMATLRKQGITFR